MQVKTILIFVAINSIVAALLLLFLLPVLPAPAAVLLSWLFGGMAAVGAAYLLARRQAAGGSGETDLPRAEQEADSLVQKAQEPDTRLDGMVAEVTHSADLIGDIAGSTEAVMYQNEQAMRPIRSAVEQMAAGAAGQAQSTQRTAEMAEELALTTSGIASGAKAQSVSVARANQFSKRVLDIVETANQAAGSAQQAGSRTAADMDSINTSVSTAAEKIRVMGERSNDIRIILEILEDIAAQTRLLTVNAAMEAARAGEGGRGFAAVASEVRRLSESSNTSVAKIRRLVLEIINSSQESAASIQQIDQSVAAGLSSAKHANETLAEIGSAFRTIQTAVTELSAEIQAISGVVEENTAATTQMASSSQQVKLAMEQVASVTRENQTAIAQINTAIADISQYIMDASVSTQSMLDMAYSIQSAVAPMQKIQKRAAAVDSPSQVKKKLTIGLAMPFFMTRPFWKKMALFAQKGAEDLGVDLLILDAEDDPQRMMNNYQSLLQRGVDGMMTVPYYDLGPRMLEEAARRSTPVIFLDTYLRGVQPQVGAYKNYLAFVGPSNAGVGYRIADYLFNQQPDSRAAALMGQAGHITGVQRTKGLEYALRKHPSVRLLAKANCDFTREDGARACAEMLSAHPEINAVWTMTDLNALGAIDAIRQSGRVPGRDVLVVGMDLDEESVALVAKGEQLCDASVHWMQAGLGLVVLQDVLRGCSLPYQRATIKLNLVFLTAGQVESYNQRLTQDGLLPFDFRIHSQFFNPSAQVGQFAVEV